MLSVLVHAGVVHETISPIVPSLKGTACTVWGAVMVSEDRVVYLRCSITSQIVHVGKSFTTLRYDASTRNTICSAKKKYIEGPSSISPKREL